MIRQNLKQPVGRPKLREEQAFEQAMNYQNDEAISAADLTNIGVMYGRKKNYSEAFRWYTKAIEKGSFTACRNLGLYHELERHVAKDLIKAAEYYQKALDGGYTKANEDLDRIIKKALPVELNAIGEMYYSQQKFEIARKWYEGPSGVNIPDAKKQLKELERKLIIQRSQAPSFDINERDSKNNTALHRAARYLHLKNVARLLFFGADKEKCNQESKKPFDYLSSVQQKKVNNLYTHLSMQVRPLSSSAPDLLLGRLIVHQAGLDETLMQETLSELYKIEAIKPLMDLAKFAVLGGHDLSRRSKFSNTDYDSDDDAEKDLIRETQKLSIHVDATRKTVEGIYHCGSDGKDAVGMYPHQNALYIGGARNPQEARATFIHELCHFVADEVFKHSGKPYAKNDLVNKKKFGDIADALKQREASLDPILKQAFSKGYTPEKYHNELIVRVAQMLVLYDDGLVRLQKQAPELLDYYQNTFLPAVNQHVDKLEQRAWGCWPKTLFMRNQNTRFSFEKIPDTGEEIQSMEIDEQHTHQTTLTLMA